MNIVNRITLAGLKKNKTRTLVTIIGVILSAAMITAVSTLIVSLQGFLIDFSIADGGDWHAVLHNAHVVDLNYLGQMEGIDALAITQSVGYAILPGKQNESKPYLHVVQFDKVAFGMLPVYLQSGRLPENADEVLVAEHINSNGGVRYEVGDKLTLQLGKRVASDGTELDQGDAYLNATQGMSEELIITDNQTLTVVGICNRIAPVEPYAAPGYTLIALRDEAGANDTKPLSIYFKAERPANIYRVAEQIHASRQLAEPKVIKYNNELLRFMGVSNDNSFNAVLHGLAAILLGLIVVGSVTLIFNSFSISVSERRKQFGLLSGAGATAQQLRHSVFFEALMIGIIGIPLGILAGIGGISTTLYFLQDALASLFNQSTLGHQVPFVLAVSAPALAGAAVLSLLTILISAYIPARRTAKMSAMDAIRQTTDIKLTAKQVKTSRLTRKLFGLEGDLALKSLKRNRRRYLSTVISLFISVVLFVSSSAFSAYLKDSVTNVYDNTDYDLSYYLSGDRTKEALRPAYDAILALDNVTAGSIITTSGGQIDIGGGALARVYIHCVDRATVSSYATELGLAAEQMHNVQAPTGIVIDKQHFYDSEEKRYLNTSLFGEQKPTTLPITVRQGDEQSHTIDIAISAFADNPPLGVPGYADHNAIILIVSDEITDIFSHSGSASMYFSAKDAFQAEEDIKPILQANGLALANVFNSAEMLKINRSVLTVISVFTYGFIVLMSLITIANVFNTISTNINLRRREFAMLKSVGMTEVGFNRMLDFECIFYGLKALLYGLPVSIQISYLIYRSIQQGVDMPFQIPVQGMLISSISVFLVVFVSMKYSRNKVRQENILDALKNDNL